MSLLLKTINLFNLTAVVEEVREEDGEGEEREAPEDAAEGVAPTPRPELTMRASKFSLALERGIWKWVRARKGS